MINPVANAADTPDVDLSTGTDELAPDLSPLRLELGDQLSVQTRELLKKRVVDLLAGDVGKGIAPRRHFVLDAASCGYIDSSGLGVLVSLNKKCRDAGGSLVLVNLNEDQRTYLRLTKMDTVLTIEPPIEDPLP